MCACVRSRLAGCWRRGSGPRGTWKGPIFGGVNRVDDLCCCWSFSFRSRERIESGRWVRVDGEHTNKQLRLCVRVAFAAVCPGFWISKSAAADDEGFGGTRSGWFPRLFDLPTDSHNLHAGGPVLAVPFRRSSSPHHPIPSHPISMHPATCLVSARLCAVWMPIGIHLGVHGGTDMTGRTHLFGHEYSSQTFVGRHKQQGADFRDSKHPNNHCQQQPTRSMSHPLTHFQQAMPWRDDVEQRSRPTLTSVDCLGCHSWVNHLRV